MHRPLSWTFLRNLRGRDFQSRWCSATILTSPANCSSSHLGDEKTKVNSWKEVASNFIKQAVDNPESLEEKYIPMKRSKAKSKAMKVRHIVDHRKVRTIGGNGGNGCASLASVYKVEKAGPDGGDGGNGGHVVFKAVAGLRSLCHVPSYICAQNGEKGKNKDCHGKNADNRIIEVPIGTVFMFDNEAVGSLEEENGMFVAARGGAGGKGNTFFATDVDQAPIVAEYGGRGEALEYDLELETMADVGLIGFPNAGKSTLLRAISRARPKVASYPFTTLNPYVGMVQYADFQQIAVADIPGLLEGAHRNIGLGIDFLKHIKRCSCLVYVLDVSQPEPWLQLDILMYELEQYQKGLSMRPHAIVANKIDLPDTQANIEKLAKHVDFPIVPVSAKLGQQLVPLLSMLRYLVDYKTARNT